jgi:hypothetical protein
MMAEAPMPRQRLWAMTHAIYWPLMLIFLVAWWAMTVTMTFLTGFLYGFWAAASNVPRDLGLPLLVRWIGYGLAFAVALVIGACALNLLIAWRLRKLVPLGPAEPIRQD